jgi:hypothetical protein
MRDSFYPEIRVGWLLVRFSSPRVASTAPQEFQKGFSANALKIVHAACDKREYGIRLTSPETRKKSCSVLPVSQQATAYSVRRECFSSGQKANAGEKTGVYLE